MAKNMFDLDEELLNGKNNKYEDELKKAYIYCVRERFDKALEIYNKILDEDMENEDAYVGLLRAHSKNFTEFDGEEIERDIRVIEKLFPDIVNEEYSNYYLTRKKALGDNLNKSTIKEKKEERIVVDSSKEIQFIKPIELPSTDEYSKGWDLFCNARRTDDKNGYLEAKKYLEPLLYTGSPSIFYTVGEIYLKTINDKYDDKLFNAINLFKYVTKYHVDKYSNYYVSSCYELGFIYYLYMGDKSMAMQYLKEVNSHAKMEEYIIAIGLLAIIYSENNPERAYDLFIEFESKFEMACPISNPKLQKYLYSECYYNYALLELKYGNKEVAKMLFQKSKDNGNPDAARRLQLMS